MNIYIGSESISLDSVKNSIENFFKKLTSKILNKISDVYTYDGGNRLVTDFLFGDKVKLSSDVLGLEISDDDIVLKSSTGTLTISGGRNKLIDFSDTYGNTGRFGRR